jgi:hypothetical protein
MESGAEDGNVAGPAQVLAGVDVELDLEDDGREGFVGRGGFGDQDDVVDREGDLEEGGEVFGVGLDQGMGRELELYGKGGAEKVEGQAGRGGEDVDETLVKRRRHGRKP